MTLAKEQKNKMPLLFIGHGSPENAIVDNEFTKSWKRIASKLPLPKAILCISAHWVTEGTAVTAMQNPKTIHDFYGFKDDLYKMIYPAKGFIELAKKIKESIKSIEISLDNEWGFDHGTWSVLANMYPKANIPVLQLSLNYYLSPEKHYYLGKELRKLRKEAVLIIGSGNLVHNLTRINFNAIPYDFAVEFDKFTKTNLIKRNDEKIINFQKEKNASLAHPSFEHFLPLLYILGASDKNEIPVFFNEKIFAASISMRCAKF